MEPLVVVALVVAIVGLCGWLLLTLFVRGRRRATTDEVRRALGGERVTLLDEKADCYGVESEGFGETRGLGCLAVNPEELLFVMWAPRKELRIDRAEIVGLEATTSHLARSRNRPLLKVRFRNPNPGDEPTETEGIDSVAWLVSDLPSWHEELA